MVARHLQYLRKTHWQSRYSISFPRLRPCTGGFQPENPMSDRQLLQLIALIAYSILKWNYRCLHGKGLSSVIS